MTLATLIRISHLFLCEFQVRKLLEVDTRIIIEFQLAEMSPFTNTSCAFVRINHSILAIVIRIRSHTSNHLHLLLHTHHSTPSLQSQSHTHIPSSHSSKKRKC